MQRRKDGNRTIGGKAIGYLLSTLTLFYAAGINSQDAQAWADRTPDAEVKQLAEQIEHDLLESTSNFASLDNVIDDFQFWQQNILPIAPPDPEYIFYAQRASLHVFDPTGFPNEFLSDLVPEPYQDKAYVYRITVCEDPATREKVIYNTDDKEIWRQTSPNDYDPWSYLRRIQPWTFQTNTAEAMELRGIYDPARIRCEYLLMPTECVPDFALANAIEAVNKTLFLLANPPEMMMDFYEPASEDFVFTDLLYTNGVVDMEVHLPDSASFQVDIFTIGRLTDFPWSLLATTPTTSGTFRVQFAFYAPIAFFRVGNADTDTDSDGIPDDRELMLYGTGTNQWDTDSDNMPDGWEVAYGLNPLDSADALLDHDNDDLNNLQEYEYGTNPNDADTDGDFILDGSEIYGRNVLIAWGGGWNGECDVPIDVTNVVAIAAGGYHAMALLSNGTIRCWGDNSFGQCDVPPDVTNAVAISAGGSNLTGLPCGNDGGHSMALLADGHVRCWGWNGENECGGWHEPLNGPTVAMPAEVSNGCVVAIAAGGFHSVALLSNGTVHVWGYNGCGEFTTKPVDLTNVMAIAAGESFDMALRNDGSVVCWGWNDFGQTNTPPDLATGTVVRAIAAGARHAVALLQDGTVRCWGRGDSGQTNAPSWITNAVSIAAGDRHSMALLADGRAICWGTNDMGQCDVPATATNVLAIAACGTHNVAIVHVRTDPLVFDFNLGGMADDLWDYTFDLDPTTPSPSNLIVVVSGPDAGNPDTDGDGLSDEFEISIGSDPDNAFMNGMGQGWLWTHFGTLDVDPDADPDGDGFTNLQEYLQGTDPNVADPADPLGVVNLQVFTPLEL